LADTCRADGLASRIEQDYVVPRDQPPGSVSGENLILMASGHEALSKLRFEALTRVLLRRNESITPVPVKDLLSPPPGKLQQVLVAESEISLLVQDDGNHWSSFEQIAKASLECLQCMSDMLVFRVDDRRNRYAAR
jgi:hypothetical protein